MKRLLGFVAVALIPLVSMPSALAEDGAEVNAGDDEFVTKFNATQLATGANNHGRGAGPHQVQDAGLPACTAAAVEPTCAETYVCVPDADSPLGGRMMWYLQLEEFPLGDCDPTPEAAPASVTPALVLQAFRRVPLPASQLVLKPPGGRTLVNFDTLFRTDAAPFTRSVTLLGQQVELRIRASSFLWHHGDGTTQTSSAPGVKYAAGRPMSDYISHQYTDAQVTVQPRVDTTYSARFRVNGGAWQDVAGTVTIAGAPVDLRVVEAQPQLVAGDGS